MGSDGTCDGKGGRRIGFEAKYRPLPKWMEKLPGSRRSGLGNGSRDGQSRGNGGSGSGGGKFGIATLLGSRLG